MQSFAMDSKGNLYIGWIFGGAITKFEMATKKTTVVPMPSTNGIPYGVVADKNDNIWVADWGGGKIAEIRYPAEHIGPNTSHSRIPIRRGV